MYTGTGLYEGKELIDAIIIHGTYKTFTGKFHFTHLLNVN